MHMRRARQEAQTLVGGSIAQVFRLQVVGLLVVVVGSLVILPRFGILTFVEEAFGLIGGERQTQGGDQQKQSRWAYEWLHRRFLAGSLRESITLRALWNGICI